MVPDPYMDQNKTLRLNTTVPAIRPKGHGGLDPSSLVAKEQGVGKREAKEMQDF